MPSVEDHLRPHLPFKIISERLEIQDCYNQMRLGGSSHKMAEMLAMQAAPALKTDTRWLGGMNFSVDENTLQGRTLLEEAKAAGVSTRGKVYSPGLASYPNDPTAWIEGMSDAKRIAAQKGMTLEDSSGTIYKAPDTYEPPAVEKPYRVADDILESRWKDAVEAEPSLVAKRDAKESLAESLSGCA